MSSSDSKQGNYNLLLKGREKGWDISILGLVLWMICMMMVIVFSNWWLIGLAIATMVMLHGTYWVEKAWHDYTGLK